MRDELTVSGGTVRGEVLVPGDKSISHRAALFAALANGTGRISGFLESVRRGGDGWPVP
jgi:3-phosphoshikimate 1-carboxyvinyltransferase